MLPIGAMAGVLKLPLVILGASLAALAAFGVLALMDRNLREGRLPLGPFLAAAAYVDWCWGGDKKNPDRDVAVVPYRRGRLVSSDFRRRAGPFCALNFPESQHTRPWPS